MNTSTNKNAFINDAVVAEIYQQMLAFAQSQVVDTHHAQDLVQEALTAALIHSEKFKGKSSFKTWVFSILKNKIVDFFRKNNRYVALSDIQSNDSQSDEDFLNTLFNEDGFWHKVNMPSAFDNSWSNPDKQVEGDNFWKILDLCLEKLPAEQSRVFLMKEYLELETKEICQEVGISSKNYYVLMHRARLRLQQCLNIRWFDAS